VVEHDTEDFDTLGESTEGVSVKEVDTVVRVIDFVGDWVDRLLVAVDEKDLLFGDHVGERVVKVPDSVREWVRVTVRVYVGVGVLKPV